MLTQWPYRAAFDAPRYDDYERDGVELLLPGGYDLVWSLATLLLPVLVVAGLVALVVVLVRRAAAAPTDRAIAARRHGIAVNLTAWSLTLVLPVLALPVLAWWSFGTASPAGYGSVVVGLLPALAALLFVGTHAFGERTWPRPAGRVRRASLTPRRVRDTAPTWLRGLLWGWAALLVVALVAFGVTARPDGRALVHVVGTTLRTAEPYPGWAYGVGLLVGVVVVVAATEATLRLVASRPAVLDDDAGYDEASRRLSAHRVLRAPQVVLALTLGVVLLAPSSGLVLVGLAPLGITLGVLGTVVVLVGLGAAVVPAPPPVPTTAPSGTLAERAGTHPR